MAWNPRRVGGRTELDIVPDQLVWALYARESLDADGEKEQVENQLDDLRTFVGEIGGKIGKEYAENDTSAFKKVRVRLEDGTVAFRVVRPVWDELLRELRKGTYNALALPNIDRGMRDPRDLEDLIDLVEHFGVLVMGMTGYLDLTTDAGIAMARNEVNQRNLESRNLSRRITTGKRRAALKGRAMGGRLRPFGWQDNKIDLNPRETALIREATARIIAGVKARTIAREWAEQGVPTVAGGQWTTRTIEQIFTSPRLCGLQTYKGEVLKDKEGQPVRGVWHAIITEEQHNALVQTLKVYKRDYGRDGRGHPTKYLLSPFVRCGKCNSRMRGGMRPGANGAKTAIYACRDKTEGGCGGCARIAEKVDEYITALVIADHQRVQFREIGELPEWDKEDDLTAIRGQLQEITTAYKERRIKGSRYFTLLEELEAEERRLEADQRRHQTARVRRTEGVANLAEKWKDPNFTLDQRQAAIAQSLQAVVIHPTRPGQRHFDPNLIEPIWKIDRGPRT
ncbi:recombinase family protein [Sphaerisporangium rubeum]|uniref:DNA invertase Pin-like site-specific DNA recombinase n=1 Tax=Sphaerisporangium rubeum TaxID=321317 RepID=A0A7X0MB15_9ACTN|nr:recombinase family protein [Sphaerisporangium rubeum]MBB6476616.1 DNA invertase Pin-like site-specific DNA recombinase [Sphaerisporangium rubeum]